ncbi:TolC family protein [Rheinheimera maricola]|uniref:TolC family protein n=1 Tax=Rheinheimera maricola TaxID=2793282 RepID=A0ABS7X522_9GAMM|nr:TolC family protein [Rheinheimera maricola]MBZ9610643.1 TolC family protein [Rheinheimera maricola]
MRMTLMLPAVLVAAGYCLQAQASRLTLPQALQRTLQHDIRLQAFPYQLRMAEAAQLQAKITPNPEVDVSLENALGTGDSRGLAAAELTLSLSQQIELGDKRQRRVELAQQQSQLQRNNYELARLDALADTTEQYVHLLQLQTLQQWAHEKISREHAVLATAQLRSEAGNLPDADISRIKLQLIRSEIELAEIQQAIESQRYRLAANWNSVPDFDTVTGDLTTLPLLPPLSELQHQLQQSTVLQRYITLERVAQSELRLTNANSKADVRLSAGLRRNEASNDNALVFSLSMPLTLSDPKAGQRQAHMAEQELLAVQQQQSRTALSLLMQQQWLALAHLRTAVHSIQSRLLPEAMQLHKLSLQAYQQGQTDLLSLLSAGEELAQAQRDVIASQSRFHITLLQLERLTGQPISLTSKTPVVTLEHSNE